MSVFRLKWISRLSVIVLMACALPAAAQTGPLQHIPATAPIVVHIRGYEPTVHRIKATITAAIPDFAPLITGQIDTGLSELLGSRELKGVAKDGPIFLVISDVPTGDDEPEMAVVIHVTNYVQFRDAFLKDEEKKELKADKAGYEVTKIDDKTTYFVQRGDYVIVTPSEKARTAFLDKKFVALAKVLGAPESDKLLRSDLSVYVDVKAVRKQHGDKLEAAKGFLQQAMELAQNMGNADKTQIEAAKKLYEGLFQLIEDTDVFVGGVDFRPEGFLIRMHVNVGGKSKSNSFLKTAKSAPLNDIGKLPAGQLAYSATASSSEFLQGLGAGMFMGLAGGEAKETKALTDAVAELAALSGGTLHGSSDYPATGVQITEFKDVEKATAATLKMFQAIPENSAFAGTAVKGKPIIKTNAEKLHGYTLHSVQMIWDFDRFAERFPEELRDKMKELMKSMLGPEMRIWFGTDGKKFVQITAKDWNAGAKLLEGYVAGTSIVSQEAGYVLTRKQLPAESNALVMIDSGRMAYFIAQYVGEFLKNLPGFPGGNLGQAKKPEGKPAYFGLAIGLQPQRGSLDLFLPAEGVKQVVSTLAPLFSGLGGE